MSLCSPVQYIYCYLPQTTIHPRRNTPAFLLKFSLKARAVLQRPGSREFHTVLKEKGKRSKHTSSHSLGLNCFDLFKSFDNQQKEEHFKTVAPVLMGYPHHRKLINDTSEFLSILSFPFSFFSKGITGIRFAEHQRCYIRTQTRKLPTVAEVEAGDTELQVCLLPFLSVLTASVVQQRLSCIL